MANSSIPVNQLLKRVRQWRELSQRQLGKISGVNDSYICLAEKGKYTLDAAELSAIETALGVRFDNPELRAAFLSWQFVINGDSNGAN